MVESIDELRKLCQETREDEFYTMSWFERNITRRVSIYLTKLFLKMGLSANQITLINLSMIIVSGILLTFADIRYWIIGILLMPIYYVFDCVDGEIARYNKSASLGGQHFDGVTGQIRTPYLLSCMTIGIYYSLNNPVVYIFGLVAVFTIAELASEQLHMLIISYRKGLLHEMHGKSNTGKDSVLLQAMRIAYRIFFYSPIGFIPQLLIMTLIDCIVEPFVFGSAFYNARSLYLLLLSLTYLMVLILTTYRNIKR